MALGHVVNIAATEAAEIVDGRRRRDGYVLKAKHAFPFRSRCEKRVDII